MGTGSPSGRTTTAPRPSRRPPSWSPASAGPVSRSRSTTSTPIRCEGWASVSGTSTATSTCWSTTSGAARYSQVDPRPEHADLAARPGCRLAFSQGHELEPHDASAVAITPGWLRSEMMLDKLRRHRGQLAGCSGSRRGRRPPRCSGRIRLLRVAPLRRARRRSARHRPGPRAVEPALGDLRRPRPRVRLHRQRRHSARRLGRARIAGFPLAPTSPGRLWSPRLMPSFATRFSWRVCVSAAWHRPR